MGCSGSKDVKEPSSKESARSATESTTGSSAGSQDDEDYDGDDAEASECSKLLGEITKKVSRIRNKAEEYRSQVQDAIVQIEQTKAKSPSARTKSENGVVTISFKPTVNANTGIMEAKEGEKLEIIVKDAAGWAYCRKQGAASPGWLPSKNVAELATLIADHDGADFEGLLSLKKGDVVEVVNRHYSGWAFCREWSDAEGLPGASNQQREGWVTDAYLEDNRSEAMLKSKWHRLVLQALDQVVSSSKELENVLGQACFEDFSGDKAMEWMSQCLEFTSWLSTELENITKAVSQHDRAQAASGSYARVEWTATASTAAELPCKANDVVYIIDAENVDWAWCRSNAGEEGWVPRNGLAPLEEGETVEESDYRSSPSSPSPGQAGRTMEAKDLPSFIKKGERCKWWSVSGQRYCDVDVDEVNNELREVKVVFTADTGCWKCVTFDHFIQSADKWLLQPHDDKEKELRAQLPDWIVCGTGAYWWSASQQQQVPVTIGHICFKRRAVTFSFDRDSKIKRHIAMHQLIDDPKSSLLQKDRKGHEWREKRVAERAGAGAGRASGDEDMSPRFGESASLEAQARASPASSASIMIGGMLDEVQRDVSDMLTPQKQDTTALDSELLALSEGHLAPDIINESNTNAFKDAPNKDPNEDTAGHVLKEVLEIINDAEEEVRPAAIREAAKGSAAPLQPGDAAPPQTLSNGSAPPLANVPEDGHLPQESATRAGPGQTPVVVLAESPGAANINANDMSLSSVGSPQTAGAATSGLGRQPNPASPVSPWAAAAELTANSGLIERQQRDALYSPSEQDLMESLVESPTKQGGLGETGPQELLRLNTLERSLMDELAAENAAPKEGVAAPAPTGWNSEPGSATLPRGPGEASKQRPPVGAWGDAGPGDTLKQRPPVGAWGDAGPGAAAGPTTSSAAPAVTDPEERRKMYSSPEFLVHEIIRMSLPETWDSEGEDGVTVLPPPDVQRLATKWPNVQSEIEGVDKKEEDSLKLRLNEQVELAAHTVDAMNQELQEKLEQRAGAAEAKFNVQLAQQHREKAWTCVNAAEAAKEMQKNSSKTRITLNKQRARCKRQAWKLDLEEDAAKAVSSVFLPDADALNGLTIGDAVHEVSQAADDVFKALQVAALRPGYLSPDGVAQSSSTVAHNSAWQDAPPRQSAKSGGERQRQAAFVEACDGAAKELLQTLSALTARIQREAEDALPLDEDLEAVYKGMDGLSKEDRRDKAMFESQQEYRWDTSLEQLIKQQTARRESLCSKALTRAEHVLQRRCQRRRNRDRNGSFADMVAMDAAIKEAEDEIKECFKKHRVEGEEEADKLEMERRAMHEQTQDLLRTAMVIRQEKARMDEAYYNANPKEKQKLYRTALRRIRKVNQDMKNMQVSNELKQKHSVLLYSLRMLEARLMQEVPNNENEIMTGSLETPEIRQQLDDATQKFEEALVEDKAAVRDVHMGRAERNERRLGHHSNVSITADKYPAVLKGREALETLRLQCAAADFTVQVLGPFAGASARLGVEAARQGRVEEGQGDATTFRPRRKRQKEALDATLNAVKDLENALKSRPQAPEAVSPESFDEQWAQTLIAAERRYQAFCKNHPQLPEGALALTPRDDEAEASPGGAGQNLLAASLEIDDLDEEPAGTGTPRGPDDPAPKAITSPPKKGPPRQQTGKRGPAGPTDGPEAAPRSGPPTGRGAANSRVKPGGGSPEKAAPAGGKQKGAGSAKATALLNKLDELDGKLDSAMGTMAMGSKPAAKPTVPRVAPAPPAGSRNAAPPGERPAPPPPRKAGLPPGAGRRQAV